jgi:mono/diheme cytochrome c family protein
MDVLEELAMRKQVGKNRAWIVTMAGVLTLFAACSATKEEGAETKPTPQEHGRYLVADVAGCADCHTPRLPNGEPDRGRWLQGAPLGFAPTVPVPAWVPVAPPIAGLPAGYTEAQFVSFLETGITPAGKMASPPMPPYRFSHEDALAVATYIKGLPRAGGQQGD